MSKDARCLSEDTSFSKKDILLKEYIPQEYMESIANAEIVVFPNEFYRDSVPISFPENTINFIDYLNSVLNVDIEYAVGDDDFKEYQSHSVDIILPLLFISREVMLSLVSSGIYDYIKAKISRGSDNVNVKLEIFQETENGSKRIKYEGPLSGIKDVMKNIDR